MTDDRRAWLEGQIASARSLASGLDAPSPFGDGGMAAHVADLEEQLADLEREEPSS